MALSGADLWRGDGVSEDWAAIAAEAKAAILDVGYPVLVIRPIGPPLQPWDTALQDADRFFVTVVDQGIRQTRAAGSSELVLRRVLLAPADAAPRVGDRVELQGVGHAVLAVQPTAPGGVPVLVKVELEA